MPRRKRPIVPEPESEQEALDILIDLGIMEEGQKFRAVEVLPLVDTVPTTRREHAMAIAAYRYLRGVRTIDMRRHQ